MATSLESAKLPLPSEVVLRLRRNGALTRLANELHTAVLSAHPTLSSEARSVGHETFREVYGEEEAKNQQEAFLAVKNGIERSEKVIQVMEMVDTEGRGERIRKLFAEEVKKAVKEIETAKLEQSKEKSRQKTEKERPSGKGAEGISSGKDQRAAASLILENLDIERVRGGGKMKSTARVSTISKQSSKLTPAVLPTSATGRDRRENESLISEVVSELLAMILGQLRVSPMQKNKCPIRRTSPLDLSDILQDLGVKDIGRTSKQILRSERNDQEGRGRPRNDSEEDGISDKGSKSPLSQDNNKGENEVPAETPITPKDSVALIPKGHEGEPRLASGAMATSLGNSKKAGVAKNATVSGADSARSTTRTAESDVSLPKENTSRISNIATESTCLRNGSNTEATNSLRVPVATSTQNAATVNEANISDPLTKNDSEVKEGGADTERGPRQNFKRPQRKFENHSKEHSDIDTNSRNNGEGRLRIGSRQNKSATGTDKASSHSSLLLTRSEDFQRAKTRIHSKITNDLQLCAREPGSTMRRNTTNESSKKKKNHVKEDLDPPKTGSRRRSRGVSRRSQTLKEGSSARRTTETGATDQAAKEDVLPKLQAPGEDKEDEEMLGRGRRKRRASVLLQEISSPAKMVERIPKKARRTESNSESAEQSDSGKIDKEGLLKMRKIVNRLKSLVNSWPFRVPVDPVLLEIPDYFDVIENPMDLGTISDRLATIETGTCHYKTMDEVIADINLVWDNCLTYNRPGDVVHGCAIAMQRSFEKMLIRLQKQREPPRPTPSISARVYESVSVKGKGAIGGLCLSFGIIENQKSSGRRWHKGKVLDYSEEDDSYQIEWEETGIVSWEKFPSARLSQARLVRKK